MNYTEAYEYLKSTASYGSVLGLENIRELLLRLGSPEKGLKFVHVAGTNGKGSTIAFVDSVLVEAGYRTGRYTSPALGTHLESFEIGEKCGHETRHRYISEETAARWLTTIRKIIDGMVCDGLNHPTPFEIETAMAFCFFLEEGCDIVLLEVGLGGRLDATNVISDKLCAVITSVSMDHMEFLGNSLKEIAKEKAGIMIPDVPVISYEQKEEVGAVIAEEAGRNHSILYTADFSAINHIRYDRGLTHFDYKQRKGLRIRMLGENQVKNAAVAIEVISLLIESGFHISEDNLYVGMLNAQWQGRFEFLHMNPDIIIDGAHNEDAALSLRKSVELYYSGNRKILIIGVLKDKDYRSILNIMAPAADLILTITPENNRALGSDELAAEALTYCGSVLDKKKVPDAVDFALETAGKDELILAFGSLSFLSEVKDYIKQKIGKGWKHDR